MRFTPVWVAQVALLILSCGPGEVPPTPATAIVAGYVSADSGTVEGAGVVVQAGGFALGCPATGTGTIGGAQAAASGAYRTSAVVGAKAESACVTVFATPPSGSPLRQSASVIRLLNFRYSPPFDSIRVDLHLNPAP